MPDVIEVKDISFRYGTEPIFSKVGFTVSGGEFVAIIGSNGTGKSTLMRLLLGEHLPDTGSIRLFGEDVSRFSRWTKIGYVPQAGAQLYANFPATVEEIVQSNLYSQIGLMRFAKREHREQVQRALALVGMEDYGKRLIGELSGGQQQRVMLARVLVANPELMLLDEPTTGVDAKTVLSLYELLAQLNRQTGLTIVMVTHDIARAVNYVGKVLCLEEGSLVELSKDQVGHELSHKHKHPLPNISVS